MADVQDTQPTPIKFLLPKSTGSRGSTDKTTRHALPRILGGQSRDGEAINDGFINERTVHVEAVYDLSGAGRDGDAQLKSEGIGQNRVLILEATDGTTLIVRADKLKQDLERLYPEAAVDQDGQVNLRVMTDQEAAARGLGSWIWSQLSVIGLSPDGIVETAKDKALELLKEKLGERYEDMAYAGASWAGAKALMWAIESRLTGEPGLYHWCEKHIQPGDLIDVENRQLQQAAKDKKSVLLFIHGTASSISGSFGDLHSGDDEGCWDNLTRGFAGRVYGYEYRSFSNSPLENALKLAKTLPKHARISLITHSQGGLIGDLLCLAEVEEELISRYQRHPILETEGEFEGKERPENKKLREAVVAEEKEQLRTLHAILNEKQFKIERYVRVACPASGTTLLSDNLDLFLSSLLSLFNFSVNLIPAVGTVGSTVLSAFRRIVLEIAEKRIDPRLIPGIEAMLPNSPLTVLLAQARRRDNVDMAVISGDADGDSGGFLKRIAIMLTDWIIFDHFDNDFVVDTQSMRAGLARRNSTREYYAHGHQVSHVHYFERFDTRRAIYKWITDPEPQKLPIFNPIPTDCDIKFDAPVSTEGQRDAQLNPNAPIVFYLPGIMGSHLEIRKENQGASEGDRVWFDPFHLAAGGIEQLSIDKKNVLPEGLFQRYYGELEAYLRQDHEVVTFAYDWRKSIEISAELLSKEIEKKLSEIKEQPQRQVSILAHSMGGLVVRAMLAADADDNGGKLWDQIVDSGGHFIMLGTPNNGSHQMVETLLGKSNAIRQLAMIDFQHDLQEIIEIVDDYDGVLQLLPHDKFTDSGVAAAQSKNTGHQAIAYHQPKTWDLIRKENRDNWFGFKTGLGAKPHANKLKRTAGFWEKMNRHNQQDGLKHAEKIAYVYGLAAHTPCGLTHTDKNNLLHLHGTVQGDGSVSWASGKLGGLGKDRYWYMPVPHASLTCSPEYYPAIVDLIRYGKTQQLSQKRPRTRSAAESVYRYEAGPVLQPGAEDLVLSFFGGRPVRDVGSESTLVLDVSVRAMDLRFAQWPVMCGHYLSDSIAGAEYTIDQHLVNGALSQRERLGIYAGEIGTNTIVMNPRSPEQRKRGSARGAIILGLGEWDQITTQKLMAATYDATLEYLLHSIEYVNDAEQSRPEDEELNLNSLLICCNSTRHITIASSIEAIVSGICKANQQYHYNKGKTQPKRIIRRLEFIECYMDTAISAAYAIRDLPRRLEKELGRLNARIVPTQELQFKQGDGARERLADLGSKTGYWARMMVTDAEQDDKQCPDECYENWLSPKIPRKVVDVVKQQLGQTNAVATEQYPTQDVVAERIKYVFLSERARAEALVQQRQPGLIEALIAKSIQDSRYDSNICRTLFQLMVPVDFKSAARQTDQLLMVLDGYTANLPWEMLQADEEPLAMRIAMVRQLVSTRYRQAVTNSLSNDACVIGNPSTADFHRHFDLGHDLRPEDDHDLPSLSGATKEAQEVTESLRACGYEVEHLYPAHPDDKPSDTALDVFNILFKKPYRILMIAAHGETRIKSRRDNRERTGVVLSDGVMLTAAEIGQMEIVPDLVFLNCCHLAKTDNQPRSYNRLAYSLSRELIEMGVRCVIAAGWAVNDDAALTFSGTFFKAFTAGDTFGKAVFKARRKTYEMHPGLNTWGAYQAYGDPNYMLHTNKVDDDDDDNWQPVAPQELEDRLKSLRVDLKQSSDSGNNRDVYDYQKLSGKIQQMLNRVPTEWAKKPGTQYMLADLYGSILPEGFEQAAKAYQQAIAEEDTDCHVPIRTLEQLANLESRQAETLSEKAEEKRIAASKTDIDPVVRKKLLAEHKHLLQKAEELSETAIQRLDGLLKITIEMHKLHTAIATEQCQVNVERFALLGGAYKRKAIILLRQNRAWQKTLSESVKFYKKGEGVSFDLNFNPYTTINRLQLEGILQERHDNQIVLAEKAQAAARQSFEKSLSFFDGVMAADAVVAMYLLDEAEVAELAGEQALKDYLIGCYEDSVKGIRYSSREFNSVTKQLGYLSLFLSSRAKSLKESDAKAAAMAERKAGVLASIVAALQKL